MIISIKVLEELKPPVIIFQLTSLNECQYFQVFVCLN